VVKVIKQEEWN